MDMCCAQYGIFSHFLSAFLMNWIKLDKTVANGMPNWRTVEGYTRVHLLHLEYEDDLKYEDNIKYDK